MKSEKIILKCARDQFDKSDLTLHREPNAIIFDLFTINGATSMPADMAPALGRMLIC